MLSKIGLEKCPLIIVAVVISVAAVTLYVYTIEAAAQSPGKKKTGSNIAEVQQPDTKLIWMQCPVGQTWNGSLCEGEILQYTWKKAQRACPRRYRLPTKSEFIKLLGNCKINNQEATCSSCGPSSEFTNPSRYYKGSICYSMFGKDRVDPCPYGLKSPILCWYWSSTSYKGKNAYAASFFYGTVSPYEKSYKKAVRCVRRGIIKKKTSEYKSGNPKERLGFP